MFSFCSSISKTIKLFVGKWCSFLIVPKNLLASFEKVVSDQSMNAHKSTRVETNKRMEQRGFKNVRTQVIEYHKGVRPGH